MRTKHTAHDAASPSTRAQSMLDGRHADSARRRQRVLTALDHAVAEGTEISASAIARAAGVDRSFLYRHRDLLEKTHALAAEPPSTVNAGPAVTRASLQADLLAAHERTRGGLLDLLVGQSERNRVSEARCDCCSASASVRGVARV